MFLKIGVLKKFAIFTGKHMCVGVFFNDVEGLQLYWKETPTQVFSCKCWEMFENRRVTAPIKTLSKAMSPKPYLVICPLWRLHKQLLFFQNRCFENRCLVMLLADAKVYTYVYFCKSGSCGSCMVKFGGWHSTRKWKFSEK